VTPSKSCDAAHIHTDLEAGVTAVEYDLNGALRSLVADLMADRPTALETFGTWCDDHTEDIHLRAPSDCWDV
jgi:hypothetical protein